MVRQRRTLQNLLFDVDLNTKINRTHKPEVLTSYQIQAIVWRVGNAPHVKKGSDLVLQSASDWIFVRMVRQRRTLQNLLLDVDLNTKINRTPKPEVLTSYQNRAEAEGTSPA